MHERIPSSRRVSRHKIRRLYKSDARGLVDEDLINQVAYEFYARCRALLAAVQQAEAKPAQRRREVVERPAEWEGFVKQARYPWEITWRVELEPGRYETGKGEDRTAALKHFVAELPRARLPREKMLLINQLTHACHNSLKAGDPHPLAVQLIAGSEADLLTMFNDLAYGRQHLSGIKDDE